MEEIKELLWNVYGKLMKNTFTRTLIIIGCVAFSIVVIYNAGKLLGNWLAETN